METYATSLRKEISDFVSVSERIQSILAQGENLSKDETGVLRFCATELLKNLPESL